MYGIIEFFKKNYFVLLFAALEFLSLYFVFKNNYYHQAGFFNSSNRIAGSVYETYSGISSYFHLSTQNEELAKENARLHNTLAHVHDTVSRSKIKASNVYGQQFDYILAEVLDNSTNRPDNYLTLNIGKDHGITEGMGVLCPLGVVGIVVNTSEHYSVVMSLLHKNFQVSAMLKKDGAFGTLTWPQGDYRHGLLSQIPMSEQLKAGDSIVTSGYSTIFPKGVPIGTIEKFKPIPDQYFYSISVLLSTNFKNLRFVYVVNNIMRQEKTELEQSTYKQVEE